MLIAAFPAVESVLGLEGRHYLIERATFVRDVHKASKVSFEECDFEVDRLSRYGHFDSVFCAGVLYHMWRPWRLLRSISCVSNHLFLSTHYAVNGTDRAGKYVGKFMGESGYGEPLSGFDLRAFWLTLDSLKQAIGDAGFEVVRERDFPNWAIAPLVDLYAQKRGSSPV
jgi:hypothetical protein